MSKDIKNKNSLTDRSIKIPLIIFGLIIFTYSLMAVINHLSLNYSDDAYQFSDSLKAIFNTETSIFKFFILFISVFAFWIIAAILIKYLYAFISKKLK